MCGFAGLTVDRSTSQILGANINITGSLIVMTGAIGIGPIQGYHYFIGGLYDDRNEPTD